MDGERGDLGRPDDAAFVVVRLDDGRQQAVQPDPVAAHDRGVLRAVFIEEVGAQLLGVDRAQLEHVPHLDAAAHAERAVAFGAGVAFADERNVRHDIGRPVALVVEVAHVRVRLVRAADQVGRREHRFVGDDPQRTLRRLLQPGRGGGARDEAGGLDLLVGHEPQVGAAEGVAQLGFVDVQVAADRDEDRLAVGGVEHRLQRLALGHVQEARHLIDGLDAGRGDLLQRERVFGRQHAPAVVGLLGVRRVAAAFADQDLVFADGGEVDELLAVFAADGARVRVDRDRRQPAAAEDAVVGLEDRVVAAVQARRVGIERVEVHHRELAQTDQAAAGARFVAELRLHLIDQPGQLLVALHVLLEQPDDHLLMRGREHELAVAPVLRDDERRHERLQPAGLRPDLGRLDERHVDLLAAGGVHLLAHDLLHLAQRAVAERQERVDARRELLDHAGAQQEPVAGRLRLGRGLAERVR